MAFTIEEAAKLALGHLRRIGLSPETSDVKEFIDTGILKIQDKVFWVASMRSLRRAGIKVNTLWFANPSKNVPPCISPLKGRSTRIDFSLIPTEDNLYILPYEEVRIYALALEEDRDRRFRQSTWDLEIDDKTHSFKWVGKGNTKSFPLYVLSSASDSDNPPSKTEQVVSRIIRDSRLARQVKGLYSSRCQLCGATVEIRQGVPYAEAHHLRPVGQPHNGPDVMENIICVCPNHHALLDFGAIALDASTLAIDDSHGLSDDYIEYYNDVVVRGQK